MTTVDVLQVGNALEPYVRRFMDDAERSGLPGAQKKAEVMELTGAVYRGASALGKLDGVKELKGVDWELLAPLVSLLIDALVRFYNAIKRWKTSKPVAAAVLPPT